MKKRRIIEITVIVILLLASASYIIAYQMNRQSKGNTFTLGDVSISITDDDLSINSSGLILPLDSIEFTPVVHNDGINAAYVIAAVTVPAESMTLCDEYGEPTETVFGPIFDSTAGVDWIEIGHFEDLDNARYTTYYVYGYNGNAVLLYSGFTTNPVINELNVANIFDCSGFYSSDFNVRVDGYAIQANNILSSVSYSGNNPTVVSLEQIKTVLSNAFGLQIDT